MTVYRPGVAVSLDVPVLGTREQRLAQARSDDLIHVPVRPYSVRLEQNDFNKADSCKVTCDWNDTALDPRMLDDAIMRVYIGDCDANGVFRPTVSNFRFVGHVRNVERKNDSDGPSTLTLEALDYTSSFINRKPFPASGIPEYSLNLDEAWRKICSQVPAAKDFLSDRLVLVGLDAPPKLATAVAARFANLGKVPTHPKTDAWAVWQQCVGMLGLVSWIDRDICIVSTATNYYSETDPPRLIWGHNIKELSESRQARIAGVGVGVTSYDPISGKTLEAVFPPPGDPRVAKKRLSASTSTKKGVTADNEEREWFQYWGVTDPNALIKVAERIWEERSRQELCGRATTSEMNVTTVSGATFDLLALKAGDSVRVEFEEEGRHLLAQLPTEGARQRYLMNKGYEEKQALLLARNARIFAQLDSTFFTKSVDTTIDLDADSISFEVTVEFINRIQTEEERQQIRKKGSPTQ